MDFSIDIDPPIDTLPYSVEQDVDKILDSVPLSSFPPTTLAPLGYIVYARSGNKRSDSNIRFYVRHAEEYPWLKPLLSVKTMKQLLQEGYNRKRIERIELPNIHGQY